VPSALITQARRFSNSAITNLPVLNASFWQVEDIGIDGKRAFNRWSTCTISFFGGWYKNFSYAETCARPPKFKPIIPHVTPSGIDEPVA
jgi:hypothetical protein